MNPILRKDFLGLIRLGRVAAMQLLCIAILGAVVLATWPQKGFVSLANASRDELALWLILGQLVIIMIFVPGFGALSISTECECNSFEMLYASRLSAAQIIVGKLLSVLSWPLILLLSSAPFMAMAYYRGGIDLIRLSGAYGTLVVAAILLALISLTISAWNRHSSTALVITYVVVLAVCGLVLVPAALMLDSLEGESASSVHTLRSISPLAAVLSLLRPSIADFGGAGHGLSPAWQIFFPFAGVVALLCLVLLTYRLSRPPVRPARSASLAGGKRSMARRVLFLLDKSKPRKPLGRFNPLIGKERRNSELRSGQWLVRVFYGTLLLSLGLAAMSLYGGAEHADLLRYVVTVLVTLQLTVVALVAPSLTSPLISSEIEHGTFELIRLTPLRPGEIFWGKFLSTVVPALLPIVALLPAYGAICFIDRSYVISVLRLLPIMVLAAAFCCVLGLTCSAVFGNTARATVASYSIVAFLFVMPLFAWWSSGSRINPSIARAMSFPSSLVIALNLLPNGDAQISEMWPRHVVWMMIVCILLLMAARLRLAQLLRVSVAMIMVVSSMAIAQAQTIPAATQTTRPLFEYGMNDQEIPAEPRLNETSSRTVDLLGETLNEDLTPSCRAEIVRDLGTCELPASAKYLLRAIADRDPMVRAEAARSLGIIHDPQNANALKQLLKDDVATVRREAVLAGAALGDPAFAQAGLEDPDSLVVIAALGAASTPDHDRTIGRRLAFWPPAVQVIALRTLNRRKSVESAEAVAHCVSTGFVPVRVAALEALSAMRAMNQFDVVNAALKHEHPAVRRAATAAIANVGSIEQLHATARAMLADPDNTVREAAARLLILQPQAELVDVLTAQLATNYEPLREAARDALVSAGKVKDDRIVGIGVSFLTNPDPRRREDGSYLLGHLRSAEALTQHIALLKDDNFVVVAQAARSLGEIGRIEAGPALVGTINRSVPMARATGSTEATANQESHACCAAIFAVAQLRYRPALAVIKPLIPKGVSRSTPVRAVSAWAYGALGDPDADTCAKLLACYGDQYEAINVKFEALKALGNLPYPLALSALSMIKQNEKYNPLRWMAYRAYDRIANTDTPYEPIPAAWSADVARVDLPAR